MKKLWVFAICLSMSSLGVAQEIAVEVAPIMEEDSGLEDVPALEGIAGGEQISQTLIEGDVQASEKTQVSAPMSGNQPGTTAVFRVITFTTNEINDIPLQAGKSRQFQDITLTFQGCRSDVGNIPHNDIAWIDITSDATDLLEGEEQPTQILFSGWMLSQYTDASTLEHPKYDVRLHHCGF